MTLLSRQDQQAPVGARAHAAPRSAATDTAVTQGGKLFGCIRVLALVAADDHKPGDRPGETTRHAEADSAPVTIATRPVSLAVALRSSKPCVNAAGAG
jgi:hypothetical protein